MEIKQKKSLMGSKEASESSKKLPEKNYTYCICCGGINYKLGFFCEICIEKEIYPDKIYGV